MKRKVVFISPYNHNGSFAGAKKRVLSLCDSYKHFDDVEVICFSPWAALSADKHFVFSLDCNVFMRLAKLFVLSFKLMLIKPDFVFSESALAPIKFTHFKLIHVIHDAKFLTKHGRRKSFLAYCCHFLSGKYSDKILTVSNSEKKRLIKGLKLPDSKIYVSYNGVSDLWHQPVKNKFYEYDLLYVSNYAKHKCHLQLLNLLRCSDLKIAFVGSDFGTLSEIKDYVSQSKIDTSFFSNLSECELIDIYDKSRVFVFPSDLEGFGMPFVEARARGLPVVCNDLPVFEELSSLICGTIVSINTPDLFLEAIKEAISTEKHFLNMDMFSWDYIAKKMLEF
ncbi:glycosyltransferase [Shewanella sp. SM101]|uniref:glycosyltransferase n=1 Tax=Shewanella sp. SM101 TaxID=2912789 RepID=UPI0021DABACE|nr:glycosyltransferase [Shewanella sp. SM101]MCU8104648.1 glycosyltransferase [Shewanella sp. SM101]